MTQEVKLKRLLASMSAERAGDVCAAVLDLIQFAQGSPETALQARQGVLLATLHVRKSVRVCASRALSFFDLDAATEARLRLLMASDSNRDVRRAAMKTLLFHWSRSTFGIEPQTNEIRSYLEGKGITRLFHLTSERNLASIKQSGAILCANNLQKNGIKGVVCVSTANSREDDKLSGTDGWVHLYFHYNQPMFYRALITKACSDLVILDVDLTVFEKRPIVFCNENSSASRAVLGPDLAHLQTLNLEPFIRGDWQHTEKSAWQAEILVHARIDWSFVTGIRRFADAAEQHRRSVSPHQRDHYLTHQYFP